MAQNSPSLIRRFFSAIWMVFTFFYRSIIILLVLAIGVGLWMGYSGEQPGITVEDNVALVWRPVGNVVEQSDRDPTEEYIDNLAGEPPTQTVLRDLIDSLDRAADDSRIRLAVLWLDSVGYAGPAQLKEMKAAIERFKASGKRVIAYAGGYSQRAYYLAAQADEVVMDPMGLILLEGYSVYNNYFPGLLDKLGVKMHIFQAGDYKTAVEPFARADMSPEAREANLDWLSTLWDGYTQDVAAGRQLEQAALVNYVEDFVPRLQAAQGDSAKVAIEAKLVDELLPLEGIREKIASVVGMDDDDYSFRQINFRRYLRSLRSTAGRSGKIGVVTVQGTIAQGDSFEGYAGADTVADLLDEAAEDDGIEALVLRVNSPGGGIYASEQMRRAVMRVKQAGKPVVVSMSTLAASGGYWISAPADEIFAHDTTITGSIGVFGLFPTFENTLDKIGVTTDGVGTTPLAGAFRSDRPLAEPLETAINLIIKHDYDLFLGHVADGRDMEIADVDAIAQGRVWSGLDALDNGLVDQLGGFADAVRSAATRAGLDPDSAKVRYLTPPRDIDFGFLSRFILALQSAGQIDLAAMLGKLLPTAQTSFDKNPWISAVERGDSRATYAHCLCVPAADALPQSVPSADQRL